MPQLDFTIVFTQIFWLLLVFIYTYSILIYFFIPLFVKSFKTRKQIIYNNIETLNFIRNNFDTKQKLLINKLFNNFYQVKIMFETKIFTIFSFKSTTDLHSIDLNLVKVLHNNTLYYDNLILNLNILNLNFKLN
uniref:ATP synthase F0 subunit 8 n=1 Tax=Synarthrophyton chejuense TaxID=2485825 RepID=A0A3G3MIF2_9FLOR|nr:ATP synthase F0 subunit 8 [Synarthrophyton chejuense]AYR06633.1 ATP synthase F0 subunit 8 [Synarthrophyton chejuense]